MLFMVIKYVEAKSSAEALRKSKRVPVTEVCIHNSAWEKQGYSLDGDKQVKVGYDTSKTKKV